MNKKAVHSQRKVSADRDLHSTELYDQPGHLLRRAHQISVSIFHAVMGPDITPVQFAALRILQDHPGIDQVTLAKYCAFDNSTAATVAVRLEAKGLIERTTPPDNKRFRMLELTPAGAELIEQLAPMVRDIRSRMLEPLTKDEQATFLALLAKFVHVNNDQSRAPLRRDRTMDDDDR